MLKPILSGFFVKTITGIDDSITRIPILATYTKTLKGKIIFSTGTLIAIIIAIIIAVFFSTFINQFTFSRELSAILVFLLAISIYFNFFHKPRDKTEVKIKKLPKITFQRATKLFGIGFIASFVTVIDDTIAYSSVLSGTSIENFYVALGILISLLIQIFLVIYFARQIKKIKYKKEISSLGLIILGILILTGII